MDPLSVLRTIWRQRWFALPAIALAITGAIYFYVEGPRTYETSAAYALANPQVPTDKQIEADPSLLDLNSNNPYLRSSDPNLIANVVITRLNARETAEHLREEGIDTEYTVSSGALGGGLVVSINASGPTPDESISATTALGDLLQTYLREVQKVDGADDRYLFTSILVSSPGEPTEKISSRLRNVIIVGVAGIVLVFAAISLGTWIDRRRGSPVRSGIDPAEPTEPEESISSASDRAGRGKVRPEPTPAADASTRSRSAQSSRA